MSKIITPSRYVTIAAFSLFFQSMNETAGSGYSFACDAKGNVIGDGMNEIALANYNRVVTEVGTKFEKPYVEDLTREVKEAAVLRCDCGTKIALDSGWANGCDNCPREYDGSGNLLAHRSQWGEETGERF